MKMYSQQHGISSFFGSDKKDFLDSWANQKDINEQIKNPKPKMEIVTEPMEIAEPTVSEKKTGLKIDLRMLKYKIASQASKKKLAEKLAGQKVGGSAFVGEAKPKPKPKPKLTSEQIAKIPEIKLRKKIHTLPTELRRIIKGFTVGDFTEEQKDEMIDLYEKVSRIYEPVQLANYYIRGDFETKIYKTHGSAGRTPAVKSLFDEVTKGLYSILDEIDELLNFEEKDRDRHRYEVDGWETREYGLTLRDDGDSYLFSNKDATAELRKDKKRIPVFQKELNRILKRADVKKSKAKK